MNGCLLFLLLASGLTMMTMVVLDDTPTEAQTNAFLAGKTILITGASKGIGKSLALAAGKRGMNVVLVARSKEALEAVAKETQALNSKTKAVAVVADLGTKEGVENTLAQTKEHFGGLDVLVLNHVIPFTGKHLQMDTEEVVAKFDTMMRVNYVGYVRLALRALDLLAKSPQGRLMTVGSAAGVLSTPLTSGYAASKAAIHSYTKSLRIEMAFEPTLKHIAVQTSLLGVIDTASTRRVTTEATRAKNVPVDVCAEGILAGVVAGRRETYIPAYTGTLSLLSGVIPSALEWMASAKLAMDVEPQWLADVVRRVF